MRRRKKYVTVIANWSTKVCQPQIQLGRLVMRSSDDAAAERVHRLAEQPFLITGNAEAGEGIDSVGILSECLLKVPRRLVVVAL